MNYLKKKGLIKGEKRGKEITYSLTKSGETAIKEAVKYFSRAFREIIEGK